MLRQREFIQVNKEMKFRATNGEAKKRHEGIADGCDEYSHATELGGRKCFKIDRTLNLSSS